MNHWIKPLRFLKFTQLNFAFQQHITRLNSFNPHHIPLWINTIIKFIFQMTKLKVTKLEFGRENSTQEADFRDHILFFNIFWFNIHCIFSHYHLVPLYPFPQQCPHCCPCPWGPFPFCPVLPPPTPTPTCHLLSIYESEPIFLISIFCTHL